MGHHLGPLGPELTNCPLSAMRRIFFSQIKSIVIHIEDHRTVRYPYDWRVSAAMWRIEEMWTRTVGQFATRLIRLHTFLQP